MYGAVTRMTTIYGRDGVGLWRVEEELSPYMEWVEVFSGPAAPLPDQPMPSGAVPLHRQGERLWLQLDLLSVSVLDAAQLRAASEPD